MNDQTNRVNKFFVRYLDRIYCAKSHLIERLPELTSQTHFLDIKAAITATRKDIRRQLSRMNEIYRLLDCKPSLDGCDGLVVVMEEAYNDIHLQNEDVMLRNLAIICYMLSAESIEATSFSILTLVASQLPIKEIKALVQQNFIEAKTDRTLFTQLANKYL